MNAERRNVSAIFFGVSIALVILLFGAAFVLVGNSLSRNGLLQRQLRTAQIDRATLLRLQLDEETGTRGYLATRNPVFLDPYREAMRSFVPTQRALVSTLHALSLDDANAKAELALNEAWHREVGNRIVAGSRQGAVDELQLRGKALVDAFRHRDQGIFDTLIATAQQADEASARLIQRILVASLIIASLILIGFAVAAALQGRLHSELEVQRQAYEDEKRIADMLQEAFIRKDLPAFALAELHGIYVPAGSEGRVGGDWYDAFELADGRILFSIGDVAGHGIEAAIVMSRVRQAILSVAVEERDPAIVLTRANDILLLQDTVLVTAACGFIDLENGVIVYSTAGHPPLLMASADGIVRRLPYWGPPLGAADTIAYRSFTAGIEPGSLLVLYTDGITEDGRDVVAGEEQLTRAVAALSSEDVLDPASAILERILRGKAPSDDVAILTIRFRASGEERQHVVEGSQARTIASSVGDKPFYEVTFALARNLEAYARPR